MFLSYRLCFVTLILHQVEPERAYMLANKLHYEDVWITWHLSVRCLETPSQPINSMLLFSHLLCLVTCYLPSAGHLGNWWWWRTARPSASNCSKLESPHPSLCHLWAGFKQKKNRQAHFHILGPLRRLIDSFMSWSCHPWKSICSLAGLAGLAGVAGEDQILNVYCMYCSWSGTLFVVLIMSTCVFFHFFPFK